MSNIVGCSPPAIDAAGSQASADARAAESGSSYRREIDGLRGLAVLAVIVNHLSKAALPGGFLGVDVFFVISGYVITASIVGRGPQPLGSFLAGFYRRRVQRLAPALIVCVAITAVLTCLFVPDPKNSLLTGATALIGVSNIFLHQQSTDYFGTDAALNTFTQTWSLGVEEQFYLAYPLVAWLLGLGRRQDRRGRLPFLAMLILVSLLSLQWFLQTGASDPSAAYFLTTGRLWELAAGGLLHELRRLPIQGGWARRLPPLPPLPPLLLLLITLSLPSRLAMVSTPLAVLATVLLLWALERPGWIRQGLMLPAMRRLGLISYSLYLWHWSVLCLGHWTIGTNGWKLPLLLALMLGLAEASYRWIETPLRGRPWSATNRGTLLKGGSLTGTLAGLIAWLAFSGGGERLYLGVPAPRASEELNRQRIAGTAIDNLRCNRTGRDSKRDFSSRSFQALVARCVAPADPQAVGPGAGRTLFVAGDSHAAALMPLESDLRRLGFGSAHLTKVGCLFPATAYGHREPACRDFQRRWADAILQRARPGDVLLIAGYWLSHLGDGIGDTRDDLLAADGRLAEGSAAKIALVRQGLNDLQARAEARGLRLLVLGAGPRLPDRENCLPEWFRPVRDPQTCERDFQAQFAHADALNRQLARGLSPAIRLIEPTPILCADDCGLLRMRSMLTDGDHYSETTARRLRSAVLQAIGMPPRQTAPERTAP